MNKKQLISFETKVARLWQAGKIKVPVHLSKGNEDELIELFKQIKKTHYVFSTHRNHYHFLLHVGRGDRLCSEILGKPEGLCKGKSGSMHTIDALHRFYSSGIVSGCCSIAVGVAKALKAKGSKRKVWCFCGDGVCDEGWFWEAVRYAHGHDLPITYIIEDNDRSVCTDKQTRWGSEDMIQENISVYNDKIIYYSYVPKFPHVGTGKAIEW